MPIGPSPITGSAVADLGLGGDLQDQVKSETDEERKKRMLQQQMGPGAMSLLGPSMGLTGGR
jgi:hypothetical protein